ncbi:hypothetical protein [Brevibacillus migulae]|uniref:hypothetical protein n=1 Tax=Brevibacillus migulae TaxID=1644114 RepID=UPI00106E9C59|nr:hypothetical protein [Brevibacillus migulae]
MRIAMTLILTSISSMLVVFGYIPSRYSAVIKRIGWSSYALTFLISLLCHWYFRANFGFPLKPSVQETTITLIIVSVFGAIFLLCGIIAHFLNRGVPSSGYNPKATFLAILVLWLHIFLFMAVYIPLGQKWEYASTFDRAERVFSKSEPAKDHPVRVELVYATKEPCSRCSNRDYLNLFMVKNDGDQAVDVKVKLYAYDADKEPLTQGESPVITVPPGGIRQIATDKTNMESSIWNQWTFRTDEPIGFYRYELLN